MQLPPSSQNSAPRAWGKQTGDLVRVKYRKGGPPDRRVRLLASTIWTGNDVKLGHYFHRQAQSDFAPIHGWARFCRALKFCRAFADELAPVWQLLNEKSVFDVVDGLASIFCQALPSGYFLANRSKLRTELFSHIAIVLVQL